MKKSLLLAACAVASLTASAAIITPKHMNVDYSGFTQNDYTFPKQQHQLAKERAAGENLHMDFTYAKDPYNIIGFENMETDADISQAFEVQTSDMQRLGYPQVTEFKFYTPADANYANPIAKGTLFIIEDIGALNAEGGVPVGNPVYSQEFNMISEGATLQTVTLDTPYQTKAGTNFIVGYVFKYTDECDYIVIDAMQATSPNTALMSVSKGITFPDALYNYASQIGSLCLAITVAGDNLPTNKAVVTDIFADNYYKPGSKISYGLQVVNQGANDITSIEVLTTSTCGTNYNKVINLAEPIAPNNYDYVTVSNVPNSGAPNIFTLTSTLKKVNGVAVDADDIVELNAVYATYNEGFARNLVVEEATGNWCGWCPRGIVMMEYLKEHYADRWIRIAVHGDASAQTKDPMTIDGYSGFLNSYIAGFPSAIVNRCYEMNMTPSKIAENCDMYYNYYTGYPAYANMVLNAECDEADKKVTVTSSTEFAFDIPEDVPHQLSFVVVQDNLREWNGQKLYQNNYYSPQYDATFGYSRGECDGWEKKAANVEWSYDDVARSIKSFPGIKNSLPAKIEKNTPYTYETTLPIYRLGVNLVTTGKFRVIGLITNTVTGEIINAAQIEVRKTGVKDVAIDDVNIKVENGSIVAEGAQSISVYSLDGRKVSCDNLSTGIYIVNVDGNVKKIMVK